MRGSRYRMKRRGLRPSPWSVPRLKVIGCVIPAERTNDVVKLVYRSVTVSTQSVGRPSIVRISDSLPWSTEPKAFVMSRYMM
jgi:hypothetical protein